MYGLRQTLDGRFVWKKLYTINDRVTPGMRKRLIDAGVSATIRHNQEYEQPVMTALVGGII